MKPPFNWKLWFAKVAFWTFGTIGVILLAGNAKADGWAEPYHYVDAYGDWRTVGEREWVGIPEYRDYIEDPTPIIWERHTFEENISYGNRDYQRNLLGNDYQEPNPVYQDPGFSHVHERHFELDAFGDDKPFHQPAPVFEPAPQPIHVEQHYNPIIVDRHEPTHFEDVHGNLDGFGNPK